MLIIYQKFPFKRQCENMKLYKTEYFIICKDIIIQ